MSNKNCNMSYYEIIVRYDREICDLICFRIKGFMNDSNDIVTEAIRQGFIGTENRKHVILARAVSEYEYEYIK